MFYGEDKTYGERGRIPQHFCEKRTEKREGIDTCLCFAFGQPRKNRKGDKRYVGNQRGKTVSNIKKRYREESLQSALTEKSRPGRPQKYTERHKAEIIAQACTKSPDGRKRWSLTLLTEEMRKKEGFETINRESIRLILKKAKQSRG